LPDHRAWWFVAWGAIAVAAFFRSFHLGAESLWFDEGYTAWLVNHSPGEIIRLIRADTAPPRYYLTLHAWTVLFGRNEAALRSLSVVFSVLTLLAAMSISWRMLRVPMAVAFVMGAMSLSYLQFWFAREARAYAMMGFLGVAAFDCMQRHLAGGKKRWLVAMALLIAAAMYTHNMMAPYVLALLAALLVHAGVESPRRRVGEFALVCLAAALLYLPWALFGLKAQMQMIRHAFWMDPLQAGDLPRAAGSLAGIRKYWSWTDLLSRARLPTHDGGALMALATALLVVSAAISIFASYGALRRNILALAIAGFGPLLLVAGCSLIWTPIFTEKVFLPSATLLPIFFFIPLGMPLAWRVRAGAHFGAVYLLGMMALTLYGYHREIFKEDWRWLAGQVAALPARPRLIVFVANDGQLPFDYYYRYRPGETATGVPSGFFDLNPPRTMRRALSEADMSSLKAALDSNVGREIVLIFAHQNWADPGHRTTILLGKRWQLARHSELRDLCLEIYDPANESLTIPPR
jgi:uncharacterized membrane protein